MEKSPVVSIVIPVYNAAPFLPQCLDSILAQTFEDFEVICVDDGSKDESLSVLKSYEKLDSRIVKVFEQRNLGTGVARNRGIEAARGKYITFIDSDDFIREDLLEIVVAKAEAGNAEIVVWDVWYYNDLAHHIQHPFIGTLNFDRFDKGNETFCWRENPDYIFSSFQNWAWNKMFRADFVRANNLRYAETHMTEDLLFSCMALVCAERVSCIYERLTYYRVYRASSALSDKDHYYPEFIAAFLELKKSLEEKGVYEQVKKSYVNWALTGSIHNLATLTQYEVYCNMFNELKNNSFKAMDIEDYGKDYFDIEEIYEDYKTILEGEPAEFLFKRMKSYHRSFLDIWARWDFNEMTIKELKSEHEALKKEHEAQMNATEQKIGQAICKLPRYVQRKRMGIE